MNTESADQFTNSSPMAAICYILLQNLSSMSVVSTERRWELHENHFLAGMLQERAGRTVGILFVSTGAAVEGFISQRNFGPAVEGFTLQMSHDEKIYYVQAYSQQVDSIIEACQKAEEIRSLLFGKKNTLDDISIVEEYEVGMRTAAD